MQWMETHRERHSDDGNPPVPWEQYLQVAPDLCTLDPAERPEALAARDLDPDTWARAESYWILTFAIDLQRGDAERADAFGRACAEAQCAARARSSGALTSAEDPPEIGAPAPEQVEAAVRGVASELPVPVRPPEPAMPSFLRTAAAQLDSAAPRAIAPVPPALVAPPRATVELPSFEASPGPAALPFTPASRGAAPVLPASRADRPAQSGVTVDLPAFTSPDLPSQLRGEGPGGARDRRTEAGTVELDPDLLAALFARKPPA